MRMRFGIGTGRRPHSGRGRPAVLGDPRTHPSNRGQGAAEAEAPQPQPQAAGLPRQADPGRPRVRREFIVRRRRVPAKRCEWAAEGRLDPARRHWGVHASPVVHRHRWLCRRFGSRHGAVIVVRRHHAPRPGHASACGGLGVATRRSARPTLPGRMASPAADICLLPMDPGGRSTPPTAPRDEKPPADSRAPSSAPAPRRPEGLLAVRRDLRGQADRACTFGERVTEARPPRRRPSLPRIPDRPLSMWTTGAGGRACRSPPVAGTPKDRPGSRRRYW